MALSRRVARLNKVGLNRIATPLAARIGGFGVIIHTGRKSGRTYRTPVNVFRTETGYVIALTYGREADWVRNVLAAGGCTLETHRQRVRLSAPRLFHDDTARAIRPLERQILRLAGIADFLELVHTDDETENDEPASGERTTCLVVGGGPAGMMLGLLLARAGVEVTVLEKHGDFLRDFRGDTVHPSTQQLLDELGLGERFAALPQSKLQEIAIPVGGERSVVMGDFRRLKVAHPYIAMVPQWDLLNLLAEAGAAEPTFTLRMRTEATDLIRTAGRVRGVRYRTADGAIGEIRADLTVACDGRWSFARGQADLPAREFPVPIDAWWFRLPRRPGDNPAALTPVAGTGRFVLVIPRPDFLQIAYIGRKGTDAQLRARGVESLRRDIAELVPWLADRMGELGSLDDVKHLDVRVNRLRRWHVDGLLCIGDAAHAMSPMGGVGINLAVQDAVAAATLLAEPLRRGSVTSALLAKVRSRRLLPTAVVQALQGLMHRAFAVPIVEGRRTGPPAPLMALLGRVPAVSFVPAYLIGVGLRPEHAPPFARRPVARAVPTVRV